MKNNNHILNIAALSFILLITTILYVLLINPIIKILIHLEVGKFTNNAIDYFNYFNNHFFPEPYELPIYLIGMIFIITSSFLFYYIYSKTITKKITNDHSILGYVSIYLILAFLTTSLLYIIISNSYDTSATDYIVVMIIFIIISIFLFIPKKKLNLKIDIIEKKSWIFDILILFIIFFLVIDTTLPIDLFHFSYFLGPTNQVIHGKTLLVDTSTQYGVLNIYFLNLLYRIVNISLKSFSFFIQTITIIFYFLLYVFLRKWIKNVFFSTLCIFSILTYDFLSINFNYTSKFNLPNSGFFIYGGFIIIALLFTVNKQKKILEYLMLTIISFLLFWSLFSGLCVAIAYFLAALINDYLKYQKTKIIFLRFFSRLLKFFIFFLIISFSIIILTFLLEGQLPNRILYLNWISLSRDGFFMQEIPKLGNYLLILVIYLVSLAYIIYKLFNKRENITIITFLTFYGILDFIYYLGRSHPLNLFNISLPAILLIFYFFKKIYYFFKKTREPLPKILNFFIIFLLIALTSYSLSLGLQYIRGTFTFENKISFYDFSYKSENTSTIEIINKYFPEDELIPVIAWEDVDILLLNNKGNLFNIFTLSSILSKEEAETIVKEAFSKKIPNYILVENKNINESYIFPKLFPKNNTDDYKIKISQINEASSGELLIKGTMDSNIDLSHRKLEIQIYNKKDSNKSNFITFFNFDYISKKVSDNIYEFQFLLDKNTLNINDEIYYYIVDNLGNYSFYKTKFNLILSSNNRNKLNFEERCLMKFKYLENNDIVVYFFKIFLGNYRYYPIENYKNFTILSKGYNSIYD